MPAPDSMPKNPKQPNFITHVSNQEDIPFLNTKLFDVNMRLFKSSPWYRQIILDVCDYLKWSCSTKKEGYKQPHGCSGANIGIPLNIVAFMDNNEPKIMINPKINKYHGEKKICRSNCGSLTLKKPIKVRRHEHIDIEFYDIEGNKNIWQKVGPKPGFTIQHEVDHNLGILITNPVRYEPFGEVNKQAKEIGSQTQG